jgi:uncharacterized protein
MKSLLMTLIFLASFQVFALNLQEARSKKLVQELPTGYLKATNSSAKAFVKEINEKRKDHYLKISKKTGIAPKQVASQAAKKIKEKMK